MLYLKKWPLDIILEDGRCWRGRICASADSEFDFPEKISGKFWIQKDNADDFQSGLNINIEGLKCDFYPYVISFGMKNKTPSGLSPLSVADIQAFMESQKLLDSYERIERNIEDCLNLERASITEYAV